MLPIIDAKREALAALCRLSGVKRLDVIGSAARGHDFDPERSDIDLIVEFEPGERQHSWAAYFDLKDGLEVLFGRPVDLIEEGALQNPFVLSTVNRDRNPVYGT